MNRRSFTLGALLVAACDKPPASPVIQAAEKQLADIEQDIGGRLGVCALDFSSGGRLVHRERERFAMCSVFKWLLVADICARAERGLLELDDSVAALCEAAIVDSDNDAASKLLKRAGGPQAVTQWLRSLGDDTTRLDRDEPDVNDNAPGDPRDTTTPEAMVKTMQTVLLGDAITEDHKKLVVEAMKRCRTGTKRLRAGMPKDWSVADKTGSGRRGAVNDVALVSRRYASTLLVACFTTETKADFDTVELAHTRVGRIVADVFR